MEHCVDGTAEPIGGGGERDPGRPEVASGDSRPGEDRQFKWTEQGELEARGSTVKGDAHSLFNWQSALYLFVAGWVCILLVPLTSFWWLALVCAMAAPVALATLNGPGPKLKKTDEKKLKERELLGSLAERSELTATTAAIRTSLTVDEASKLLEELAHEGHLELRMEDGVMVYALQQRDRHELPGGVTASREKEGECAPSQLEELHEPLSEREIEVLHGLASGRTNSEVARDLFISVGTVKSHTNNIYRKLGARNRTGALARARGLDLLSG